MLAPAAVLHDFVDIEISSRKQGFLQEKLTSTAFKGVDTILYVYIYQSSNKHIVTNQTMLRIFSRSASTVAAKQIIKPPVKLFGVDGTYATALFIASSKESNLDSTSKSLFNLSNAVVNDAKVAKFINTPTLTLSDRKEIVNVLNNNIGNTKNSNVTNLLEVLAENNRLSLIPKISENFKTLLDASNGIINCKIISATRLDSKTIKKLEKSISTSQLVSKDNTINLINEVKPDIKGGLIINIGDKTIDLSLSSKIQRLNKLLEEDV